MDNHDIWKFYKISGSKAEITVKSPFSIASRPTNRQISFQYGISPGGVSLFPIFSLSLSFSGFSLSSFLHFLCSDCFLIKDTGGLPGTYRTTLSHSIEGFCGGLLARGRPNSRRKASPMPKARACDSWMRSSHTWPQWHAYAYFRIITLYGEVHKDSSDVPYYVTNKIKQALHQAIPFHLSLSLSLCLSLSLSRLQQELILLTDYTILYSNILVSGTNMINMNLGFWSPWELIKSSFCLCSSRYGLISSRLHGTCLGQETSNELPGTGKSNGASLWVCYKPMHNWSKKKRATTCNHDKAVKMYGKYAAKSTTVHK